MRYQRALFSSASIAICVWPLQVLAQSEGGFALEEAPAKAPVVITTSSAELGLGWLSQDSAKFGEYSGLTDRGAFVIGNVDFLWRAPFDGESTEYWKIGASNIGLDKRAVRLEAGQQGRFGLYLNYSEIPHHQTDDSMTPYIGAGSTNLTLPPNWVASDNTPAQSAGKMTQLDASLNPVRLKTERTRGGGGFTYQLDKEWSVGGSYAREEKNGLESIAGIFAASGGNPRSALLTKPIDYTTQDANIFVAYNTERLQAQIGYHLSQFDDNNTSLSWQNAYQGVSGWSADQSYSNGGFGTLALEPDNTAHSVSMSFGYALDPTSRVAGSFTYTKMLQNDAFLPYAVTGFDSGGLTFGPLPRDSLEGKVENMHGALSYANQITPDLNLSAQYIFDDHNNQTPTDIFCYVPSDSANQDAACAGVVDQTTDSTHARINRPYDRTQHDIKLDATYRVMPSTKIALGYAFQNVNRDLTEVKNTYEHTGSIKVMSSPFTFGSGWLKYSFSDRSGSDYIGNAPVLASYTEATIEEEGGTAMFWEANPFLRKYYVADRRRHRLAGSLNLMATEELSIGLLGSVDMSDYYNTDIGLTDRTFGSATLDLTYTPNEDIALFGFVTYDRMKNKQNGYEHSAHLVPGFTPDPKAYWSVDTLDQGYTAGIGADWTIIKDKLKFGVDYTYSHTNTHYTFGGDPTLGAEPVPDVTSTLHSVGAKLEYMFADGVSAKLFYRYERFRNDDFANDVGSSIPYVITLGSTDLDYDEHMVGLSIRYQF